MMKHLGEDSKRENCCYHHLAPVDSIDSEEESIQALRWAIKNPKVHNICLRLTNHKEHKTFVKCQRLLSIRYLTFHKESVKTSQN